MNKTQHHIELTIAKEKSIKLEIWKITKHK